MIDRRDGTCFAKFQHCHIYLGGRKNSFSHRASSFCSFFQLITSLVVSGAVCSLIDLLACPTHLQLSFFTLDILPFLRLFAERFKFCVLFQLYIFTGFFEFEPNKQHFPQYKNERQAENLNPAPPILKISNSASGSTLAHTVVKHTKNLRKRNAVEIY